MAVSGVSSSSSIYGTRNVISGLASGMDTESMIENAVSGYQTKISALQQKRTKTEWKQEAYRSIIAKMANLTTKYSSYTSSTNLFSTSFFNQAIKTVTNGENAGKVSATGRSSSTVAINRVQQLATAARYSVSAKNLGGTQNSYDTGGAIATADGAFSLTGETEISTLKGSMTLTYGSQDLSLSFKEGTVFNSVQELADNINSQLASQTIAINGNTYKASERISVSVTGSGIAFSDKSGAGNNVYIKSAAKEIRDTLNISPGTSATSFRVQASDLRKTVSNADYLSSSDMNITLDGVTKTIQMPTAKEIAERAAADTSNVNDDSKQANAYIDLLQERIDKAFGKLSDGNSKLTVSNALSRENNGSIKLSFTAGQPGSSFEVKSDVGVALQIGENGLTSYLDTSKKLGDLGIKLTDDMAVRNENGDIMKDESGNTLYSFKVNGEEVGQFTKESSLSSIINAINSNKNAGVTASYSKITNEFVFTAKETGTSGKIDFGEKGSLADALFGGEKDENGDYAAGYQAGQDAIFQATVNGSTITMTRSSNTVDIDGMKVTLKDTFGYGTEPVKNSNGDQIFSFDGGKEIYGRATADGRIQIVDKNGDPLTYSSDSGSASKVYATVGDDGKLSFTTVNDADQTITPVYLKPGSNGEAWFSADKADAYDISAVTTANKEIPTEAVSFTTSADADKIVDAIKSFVDDYNEMITEIKKAYSTLPIQKTSGEYYEPLTQDQENDLSESAIEAWNEKAKTGLLFGDTDLSSLYRRLTQAISMTGEDGAALRAAGITTSYSDGLTLLSFDENTLRDTLDNDPDAVTDIFTKSKENGAATDGIMAALKTPLDMYGKTTGSHGILVSKAGSVLSPSTLYSNYIQTELDNIDKEIEKWQDKLSDRVDYYTQRFSALEQMIANMNSQSSALASMMGGY